MRERVRESVFGVRVFVGRHHHPLLLCDPSFSVVLFGAQVESSWVHMESLLCSKGVHYITTLISLPLLELVVRLPIISCDFVYRVLISLSCVVVVP